MRAIAILAGFILTSPALAGEKAQLVTIEVIDTEGTPIANAWVRLPGTEGRRSVEPLTGVWEASMLYTYAGDPIVFTKGMALDLTVSAPGFVAKNVLYKVAARRNIVQVLLDEMEERDIVLSEEVDPDALMIKWFERTSDAE